MRLAVDRATLFAVLPSNAVFLIEEAWNAFPHCRTVLVNGYFDTTKFRVVRMVAGARPRRGNQVGRCYLPLATPPCTGHRVRAPAGLRPD